MKTLIIYAHPQTEGHCSLILEKVQNELTVVNQNFEVLDLYKLNYDPILHESEHYTAGGNEVAAQTISFQNKIKESDSLIIIYPVWWGTMPAILKGFFDKVLLAGFAYKFAGKGLPQKLLKGKKASVIMTSGRPVFFLKLAGNRPKKSIKKDILGFCGIEAKVFQIGGVTKVDDKMKEKIASISKKVVKFVC